MMRNLPILIMLVFGISCSLNNEMVSKTPLNVDDYLVSESFKALRININDLEVKAAKFQKSRSSRDYLYIPFKGSQNRFILAAQNSGGSFLSTEVVIETTVAVSDFQTAFFNGTLNATFKYKTFENQYDFQISNSKVIQFKESKMNARRCTTLEVGECAAIKIDQMGPVTWALCMAEIILCLAAEMADCIIEGCVNVAS